MTHTLADIHINEIKKREENLLSLTQNLIAFLLQMAEHKGDAVKRWGWRFPVAADFQKRRSDHVIVFDWSKFKDKQSYFFKTRICEKKI